MEFNATFLVTIVSFVIFVFVMNKVLYKPVLSIMEERKNFIEGNYKAAEENDTKRTELENEREEKLVGAKNDAKIKYNETLSGYKEQKTDIIHSAEEAAKDELERARGELDNLSSEVKEGLKGSMKELANDIVEKVLGYRSEIENFDEDTVNRVLYH